MRLPSLFIVVSVADPERPAAVECACNLVPLALPFPRDDKNLSRIN